VLAAHYGFTEEELDFIINYDITGAKCQLVVTEDTITVMSPGAPLPPITMEQLQSFTAPMLSRNPALHYVFARMGMAEERGLGIKSLKAAAERQGLPLPRYAWDAPYLSLTLYRSRAGAERTLDAGILASLSKAERSGWQWLSTRMLNAVPAAEVLRRCGSSSWPAAACRSPAPAHRRTGSGPG